MAEPVMRILEFLVPLAVRVNGTTISYDGLENIPERGGALIAVNHTGYLDWVPGSLGSIERGRRLRFMIKAEMKEVAGVNFIIKHIGLIPVDRRAGADAFGVAVQRLKEGELVGVHPEATISRSFELKEFKTGTARMAHDAGVPIIPFIVWGAQRIWTKDHRRTLWRNKVPVVAKIGSPLTAAATIEQTTANLYEAMTALLHQVQEEYPHPPGEFWVPQRLGGGAPSPAEALAMHDAEMVARERRRAERAQQPEKRSRLRRRATPPQRVADAGE